MKPCYRVCCMLQCRPSASLSSQQTSPKASTVATAMNPSSYQKNVVPIPLFDNSITDQMSPSAGRQHLSSFNKIPQVVSKQFPNQFQDNSPVSFKTIPHFFY